MPLIVDDAAVEFQGACIHSLRFSYGAPVEYPYAARLTSDKPPPTLFRRVQAAAPPPTRAGDPWYSSLVISGDQMVAREDAVALDRPDQGSIVLDEWFGLPRRSVALTFPGADAGRCIASVPYWAPGGEGPVIRRVQYFGAYFFNWKRLLSAADWVAVSFTMFWPPERDSPDLLIQLGDCVEPCP